MITPSTPWTPLCVGIRSHLAAMSPTEIKVYLALVTRRNTKTGQLNPTVPTLAADAGCHEDVVSAALSRLVARGLVQRQGTKFRRSYALPDVPLPDHSSGRGNLGMMNPRVDERSEGLRGILGVFPDESSGQSNNHGSSNHGSENHMAAAPLAGCAGGLLTGTAPVLLADVADLEGEPDGRCPEAALDPSVLTVGAAGSPAAAEAPAGSPRRRKASSSGKGSAKPARGLTDEQMLAVCSSPAATAAYWCHGLDAVGKPSGSWASLPPSKTHWSPGSRDLTKPAADVGFDALAAWTWVQFAKARAAAGVALSMPDFGKLARTVKTLRGRTPLDEFVAIVGSVSGNWQSIVGSLSWMSPPPSLDELTLTNARVLDAARRLAAGQAITPPKPPLPDGWTRTSESTDFWKGSNYATATAN